LQHINTHFKVTLAKQTHICGKTEKRLLLMYTVTYKANEVNVELTIFIYFRQEVQIPYGNPHIGDNTSRGRLR
jgi:hypothetical protein